MSQKLSTVSKQSRPKTVAIRRHQPSLVRLGGGDTVDRPLTSGSCASIDRKPIPHDTLQQKPPAVHKLGHLPDYLRKGRSKTTEASPNLWEEKCHKLEEEISRYKETSDAQRQLIESLRERIAQLDVVVLEIKPELARLCSEIEARERKIQSLERSLADKEATKLDLLQEELQGLKQLVQQPADVFQYYGHQLNSTMDMLARSYFQLLSMAESRRTDGYAVYSGAEEESDRNFCRQKMRLDKRNKNTQIRVKKYNG